VSKALSTVKIISLKPVGTSRGHDCKFHFRFVVATLQGVLKVKKHILYLVLLLKRPNIETTVWTMGRSNIERNSMCTLLISRSHCCAARGSFSPPFKSKNCQVKLFFCYNAYFLAY
jgi:hypothetical protein